jgi:hypothetical protein
MSKPRRQRGPTKKLEGRYIITQVSDMGEPVLPKENATKFVNIVGFLWGMTSRLAFENEKLIRKII